MTPPPRWHHNTSARADIQRALVSRAAPNPLVVAWRWRYEIIVIAALVTGLAIAVISLGDVPTIITIIVVALIVLCWPTTRQFAVDRAWCIITPHRVRVGCAEGLVYSSHGKIPIILWTSHRAFGERVVLWCRAGTGVEDFVSARAILITTCWAQDVGIFFDPQRTHLVTLDVIRRPPGDVTSNLEGHHFVDSTEGQATWPNDQNMSP